MNLLTFIESMGWSFYQGHFYISRRGKDPMNPLEWSSDRRLVAWQKTKPWEHQFGARTSRKDGQGSSRTNWVCDTVKTVSPPRKIKIVVWRALHCVVPGMTMLLGTDLFHLNAQCVMLELRTFDIYSSLVIELSRYGNLQAFMRLFCSLYLSTYQGRLFLKIYCKVRAKNHLLSDS